MGILGENRKKGPPHQYSRDYGFRELNTPPGINFHHRNFLTTQPDFLWVFLSVLCHAMSVFSKRGTKRVRRIAYGEIKRVVGIPELKFLDSGVGNTAAPNITGAGGILSGMAGGSSVITRAGNEIRCRSLLMRINFTNTVGSTAPITWRFILGIDWENVGGAPTGAQILEDPNNILSPINITLSNGRFSILTDKTFITNPGSTAAGVAVVPGQLKTMKFFKRLHHTALFGTALAASTLRGAVFYYAQSSAAGLSAGEIAFRARFRWTDV